MKSGRRAESELRLDYEGWPRGDRDEIREPILRLLEVARGGGLVLEPVINFR